MTETASTGTVHTGWAARVFTWILMAPRRHGVIPYHCVSAKSAPHLETYRQKRPHTFASCGRFSWSWRSRPFHRSTWRVLGRPSWRRTVHTSVGADAQDLASRQLLFLGTFSNRVARVTEQRRSSTEYLADIKTPGASIFLLPAISESFNFDTSHNSKGNRVCGTRIQYNRYQFLKKEQSHSASPNLIFMI